MSADQPKKRTKVQVGARLDPAIIELWDTIDEMEEVGNKTKVLEWAIASGYLYLSEQTGFRNTFAILLIRKYGADAVVSVRVSGEPGAFEKDLRVNGKPSDLIGAGVVEAGVNKWNIVVFPKGDADVPRSAHKPRLVLGSFSAEDVPHGVAEVIKNIGLLKLLESPASGVPLRRLNEAREATN